MKEVSKFVEATLAFLTGDTDKAVALKNERLAKAAIKGQLSALEGVLVNEEVTLENAKETLEKTIQPTSLISSQEGYVKGVLQAQERVNDATDKLEATKSTIDYLEKLLKAKF